ncbi:MAG: deoxyribodipyrimidine photo-lyase [Phycisphaerales bacterium]
MHRVPGPTSIVWHRTDLRLADNAAVTAAAKDAPGGVVGAVVLPGEPGAPFTLVRAGGSSASTRAAARADPPGVTQWSPRRLGHLLQAIDGLRAEWHAAGSGLFVLRGDPAECIPALVADLNACAVHTAPCPAVDELRENEAVARALGARGAELHVPDETTMTAGPARQPRPGPRRGPGPQASRPIAPTQGRASRRSRRASPVPAAAPARGTRARRVA